MDSKISIHIEENETYIRNRLKNCDDCIIRPMLLGEREEDSMSGGLYRGGSQQYDAGGFSNRQAGESYVGNACRGDSPVCKG